MKPSNDLNLDLNLRVIEIAKIFSGNILPKDLNDRHLCRTSIWLLYCISDGRAVLGEHKQNNKFDIQLKGSPKLLFKKW